MLSPSGRVARSAERGHDRTRPLQSAIADSFPSVACRCSRLPLACIKFCLQNFMQAKMGILSLRQGFPSGRSCPHSGLMRGSSICLAKNFQTKGQFHFRLKSFRTNQSHPSFASLLLGTFPPRGRLNFCRIHGFPSGGGSSFSCFPLRGEWREAPREDMTGLDLFSRLSPTAGCRSCLKRQFGKKSPRRGKQGSQTPQKSRAAYHTCV